jgi:hypothetical protein
MSGDRGPERRGDAGAPDSADRVFEQSLRSMLRRHLDGVDGPAPHWLGPEVELVGGKPRARRNRFEQRARRLVAVAAVLAVFVAGVSVGQYISTRSGAAGPQSSSSPSSAPTASDTAIASGSAIVTPTPVNESSAPIAATSPSGSPTTPQPSPSAPPSVVDAGRPELLTWWKDRLVVRRTPAQGPAHLEVWDLNGHGWRIGTVPVASPTVASDGNTLLVDTCGPRVWIYETDFTSTMVSLGSMRASGSCQPVRALADGGYYTWKDGSITVIGTDGSVTTKSLPSGWVVLAAGVNGDGVLVRPSTSSTAVYTVYEWDRNGGAPYQIEDKVTSVMAGPQSIDVVTLAMIRRVDDSWWPVYYEMPNLITIFGLPNDQIASVARSFIAPSMDMLAEQAARCGTGCLTISNGGRTTGIYGRLDAPIYEVIATDHMMAISTGKGMWLARATGISAVAVPATLTDVQPP